MAKTNWYSEIPYEVEPLIDYNNDDEERVTLLKCVTKCPFGKCLGSSEGNILTVGSIAESVNCEYYVDADLVNKIVKCTNPLNLE